MLKIRLRRMGTRKKPFYRVVVSDSRFTPRGPFNAILGTYDPGCDPARVVIDVPSAEEWIRKGAHASETVARLIETARQQHGSAPD
ncbi:MAG: 30S ribosomal protein S16 [Acidobacteriota bacterium]